MNPDDFKQTWKAQSSQSRLTIDTELLLENVRRDQRNFSATIFWRDVREAGTSLLMMPLWFYLGVQLSLPWTWYLTIPVLLWIAGYMLTDRLLQRRQPSEPDDPLRQRVESSLAQVDHQIWLLRNVFWWYLLPIALSMLAFFAQVSWEARSGGWLTALVLAGIVIVEVIILGGVYWLNQNAVRSSLVPRRQELEALLMSLKDETPAVDS